jgi:hypothetical protein
MICLTVLNRTQHIDKMFINYRVGDALRTFKNDISMPQGTLLREVFERQNGTYNEFKTLKQIIETKYAHVVGHDVSFHLRGGDVYSATSMYSTYQVDLEQVAYVPRLLRSLSIDTVYVYSVIWRSIAEKETCKMLSAIEKFFSRFSIRIVVATTESTDLDVVQMVKSRYLITSHGHFSQVLSRIAHMLGNVVLPMQMKV